MEFTSAAWLEECQFPRRFKNILPTEAEIFSALQRENTERLEDIMGHHSSHVTWSVTSFAYGERTRTDSEELKQISTQ